MLHFKKNLPHSVFQIGNENKRIAVTIAVFELDLVSAAARPWGQGAAVPPPAFPVELALQNGKDCVDLIPPTRACVSPDEGFVCG